MHLPVRATAALFCRYILVVHATVRGWWVHSITNISDSRPSLQAATSATRTLMASSSLTRAHTPAPSNQSLPSASVCVHCSEVAFLDSELFVVAPQSISITSYPRCVDLLKPGHICIEGGASCSCCAPRLRLYSALQRPILT